MKRSRMICCGKQTHSAEDNERPHRLPHPRLSATAENRGAHNKYAASDSHHASSSLAAHLQLLDGSGNRRGEVDVGDLTVTLPGMVVGGKSSGVKVGTSRHASSGSSSAPPVSDKMHISNSDKTISKKEKARQKFSNNILKRAKVLITDRASQSSSPYKVNSTPALSQDKFKVLKIKAAIDKKPTSIDERSTAVLKYRTPHFRYALLSYIGEADLLISMNKEIERNLIED